MSAQEFKPGDRVRVIKASGSDGNLAIGDEHVVKRVNSAGDVSWGGQVWARERFVKVEPEFVVGQQVKDEDYDRLPVGAKAGTIEKTGEHEWRDLDGRPLFQSPHATRHLNYLPEQLDPEDDSVEAYCVKDAQDGDWWVSEATPEFGYGIVYSDGTHPTKTNDLDAIEANYGIDAGPEPEDKDDLYVEPEPLKRGDAVLVWARVVDAKPDSDGDLEVVLDRAPGGLVDDCEAYVRADAIVRPAAGQVPPWVKAEQDEAKAISAIKTALVVDGGMHDDRYTQQTAESLYRAGIRATKGGAS